MSVDAGHRGKPNRGFESAALKLLKHTVLVTSNDGIFLPKYDKIVTLDIIYEAKTIYANVIKANKIRVKDKGDGTAKDRLELQEEALKLCKDMIDNITVAKPILHLKAGKAGYWIHLVNCAYNVIEKWHESDIKRYKSLI